MKRADPWLIATIGFADRDAIHVLGYLKVRSVNKGARSNQSTSFSAASVAGSDPTSWTGFVSMTRLSVSHAHYRYEERETAAASHRERKTREGTSFGSGSFFTALADSSLYRSRGEATAIRGSSLQTLRRTHHRGDSRVGTLHRLRCVGQTNMPEGRERRGADEPARYAHNARGGDSISTHGRQRDRWMPAV